MIITHNDTTIAEQVDPQYKEIEEHGILFKIEQVPTYRVICTDNTSGTIELAPGDVIVCSNLGAKFEQDGKILYMFKNENIIGTVSNG